MLERFRDIVAAMVVDHRMRGVFDRGTLCRETVPDWAHECMTVTIARRTGAIELCTYRNLSPAAKELLPQTLVLT